jgi:hypothetical protein
MSVPNTKESTPHILQKNSISAERNANLKMKEDVEEECNLVTTATFVTLIYA